LWASTGNKDPNASDLLYVTSLAAPFTINTMPEKTLQALADHGEIGPLMAADGDGSTAVLGQFARAGIKLDELAAQLQQEGARSFVESWNDLMTVIVAKGAPSRRPLDARQIRGTLQSQAGRVRRNHRRTRPARGRRGFAGWTGETGRSS
jgi:hypothetical protein